MSTSHFRPSWVSTYSRYLQHRLCYTEYNICQWDVVCFMMFISSHILLTLLPPATSSIACSLSSGNMSLTCCMGTQHYLEDSRQQRMEGHLINSELPTTPPSLASWLFSSNNVRSFLLALSKLVPGTHTMLVE